MPRNRVVMENYFGPHMDARVAAVAETGKGLRLVLAANPSHRWMHRGKLKQNTKRYQAKGTGRGAVVTEIGVTKEAALALHTALGKFLFGDRGL